MSDMPEPAPEIIMDARGIYWRRYPDMLSMVPVSNDNEPVPYPYVIYRRVGSETEWGFASTATGDLVASAETAEQERDALRKVVQSLVDYDREAGSDPDFAEGWWCALLTDARAALASHQEWEREKP